MRTFLKAVDSFYDKPEEVLEAMRSMEFTEPKGITGYRTVPYLHGGRESIIQRITQAFGSPIKFSDYKKDDFNGVFFSAFNRGARGERPGIHYDSDGCPNGVAMLVYLTKDAPFTAGTSTWHYKPYDLYHAPTAKDAKRCNTTREKMRERMDDHRYYTPKLWEEVDRVGNKFNRAVFYPLSVLHSATRHFGSSFENGRFYQTFWFDIPKDTKQ